MVYAGLASRVSYQFISDALRRDMKSNSWVSTPLQWPQMAIPIGYTLLTLVLAVEIGKVIRDIHAGVVIESPKEEMTEEHKI
jgi:TRAP-type C4-dicarboxylate transport system permease small subunit